MACSDRRASAKVGERASVKSPDISWVTVPVGPTTSRVRSKLFSWTTDRALESAVSGWSRPAAMTALIVWSREA